MREETGEQERARGEMRGEEKRKIEEGRRERGGGKEN